MPRKKISRNAPCPCGSGRKYKNCCYHKAFDWMEDDDGNLGRSMPVSDELANVLDAAQQAFIDKYGREPGPDDLLFPEMPHGEVVEHMMVEGMKEAGMDPAFIYAFETTGLLVSEENIDLIPEKDLERWQAAIEEYEDKQAQEPPEYPIGTVAYYGPDDQKTTKIAAVVYFDEDAKSEIQRWVGTEVTTSEKVQRELQQFFEQHGVKSVAMSAGNMGCPHEEGEDFPVGEDCPFCPFWKGKQGSNSLF